MELKTLKILKRLLITLSPKKRIYLLFILLISILSGLLELVSLSSVVPFLAVLNNPNLIWENQWVQSLLHSYPYFVGILLNL